jgi:hypothetical protein
MREAGASDLERVSQFLLVASGARAARGEADEELVPVDTSDEENAARRRSGRRAAERGVGRHGLPGYAEFYRTGRPGAMDPASPPSRFHVDSGVPYFDAREDGTPVRHRLYEFQPGLFLAGNGETLDVRGPSSW